MKYPFEKDESRLDMIHVESIFGVQQGRGLVNISWGDHAAQFTPAEARAHAFGIIECAAAAEQDEIVMEFIKEKVGVDQETAAHMLVDLRRTREKIAEKHRKSGRP